MSERLKAAIEEIEATIRTKEAEIINPLKITVNQLCLLIGEPARYEIDGTGVLGKPKVSVLTWRADQFFGRPLAQCVTEYFETREAAGGMERAASVDDIYEALSKGGYKFEGTSGNEDNTKRGIKISLTKNTAQFAKIGELFGLKKWYPNAKIPRKPNGSSDEKTEPGAETPAETLAEAQGVPENEDTCTDETKP